MEIESIAPKGVPARGKDEHEDKRLKLILGSLFLILVVGLLVFYWIVPRESIVNLINSNGEFLSCSEFEFDGDSMQFYENMRYVDSNISYSIEGCSIQKRNDATRAFNEIENKTALSFYEISTEGEIIVSCDSTTKIENGMFIAGEGGPVNITKLNSSHLISGGKILLLDESNCGQPIVAIHEIFHALGFTHSNNVCNIMYNSSKCSQEIGNDMIQMIDELYSYEPLPDLEVINISGELHDKYLDLNFSVRNYGLLDSKDSFVEIYSNGELVKNIDIGVVEFGSRIDITLINLSVVRGADNVSVSIIYEYEELNKINNFNSVSL